MAASSELPAISYSAALRRTGGSSKSLERRAAEGSSIRIRPGAYADAADWRTARPAARHLARVIAAHEAARSDPVFSHESAAAVWGIPLVEAWPELPQATAPPASARRSTRAVHWHRAPLDEVCRVGDLAVTSPLRTVLDLISIRSFLSGVVALDHVLRHVAEFGVTQNDLLALIGRTRPFRGARRAEATARFADHRSESPGESVSRVRFFEAGLPIPVLQKLFIGVDGREYHTDFYFPEEDTIAESDGWTKYEDARLLRGRTPAEVLRAEKRREDALRPLVTAFVRWDWDDAWRGAPMLAKLRAAGVHPRQGRGSLRR